MRPRLCCEWLHACCGCEIALLNCGERLLLLLERVEIVHFPLLMDHKYPASGGLDLPEADIGLVSGAVASEEQRALLQTMRARCRVLVALGTCATHGGIPAMRNQWPLDATLATVYSYGSSEQALVPPAVTTQLDRVCSVDEQVRVDLCVPGCPPEPEAILAAIDTLLLDRPPAATERKSVCETCPTQRLGTGQRTVRRFLANVEGEPGAEPAQMRCLLEQGQLCMGPVTAGGCGGTTTPLCIRAHVPCRGCYGPVRPDGNPLLDMLSALASKGIEYRGLVDRKSLLRFCGAHGLLKPVRKRV
jgi:F420-non-reducing hydrogenase small subunit